MNITQVSFNYPPSAWGGAENYAHIMGRHLSNRGHHIRVVTASKLNGSRRYNYEGLSIQAFPTRSKFPFSLITRTYNPSMLFRKMGGGDLAHVHVIGGFSPLVFNKLRSNHKAVTWTAHDPQLMCGCCLLPRDGSECKGLGSTKCPGCLNPLDHLRRRMSTRHHVPYVDAFIAPSKWMMGLFKDAGYPKDKLHLIMNGIDTSIIPFTEVPTEPVILFCGKMSPNKGLMVLLRAFDMVLDEMPDAKLLLVGDGKKYNEGRAYATRAGIIDSTIWVGYQKNTEFFYKSAKVVAHPSIIPENCSLVLLEAHASGRASVSTKVGGNGEIIDPGVTGWLSHPGDEADLAEKLVGILASDDVARRMGHAARARAESLFSIDRAVDDHCHLFHNLVKEASA